MYINTKTNIQISVFISIYYTLKTCIKNDILIMTPTQKPLERTIFMKKLLFAAMLFLFTAGTATAAEVPIDIRVNGEYILTDTEPVIHSGVTYAPLRAISDSLGATSVMWNESEQKATVVTDNNTVSVYIGSDIAYINDLKIKMTGISFILNDRTYIPVRSMSNMFNASVNWDDKYKNVEINKNSYKLPDKVIDHTFTHDELYWMAQIINAESGGEPLAGKIAVGDVILNRVKSSMFPNTIYGVIFDRKHGVQFEPTINGSIYNSPSTESIAAAKLSLTNKSTIGNCLYFFNPKIASSSWISENRYYYTTIGDHAFYL